MKMASTQLYNFSQSAHLCDTSINEGMIIIPDISGYTRFVHSTDVITGSNITYELLSTIIENNILDLQVSEIEGFRKLYGEAVIEAHRLLKNSLVPPKVPVPKLKTGTFNPDRLNCLYSMV